jgi:hypothetical protein
VQDVLLYRWSHLHRLFSYFCHYRKYYCNNCVARQRRLPGLVAGAICLK